MEAVAIEVNGGFLDLEDSSLRLEIVNAAFITELYQGDYSFPFELKASVNNSRLLKYVDAIEKRNREIVFDAVIYLFGIPKNKSKLRVNRSRNGGFSIVINGGIAALTYAKTKLAEIPLAEPYTLGNSTATVLAFAKTASLQGDWKTYGFTFVPFFAPNFYDTTNPDFLGVCNRVDVNSGDILANSTVVIDNKYNLVPWLFLFFVLDQIFKAEGLTPSGDFWEHPELSKLLLFNNRALDARPGDSNTLVIGNNSQTLSSALQIVNFDLGPAGTYDNAIAWSEPSSFYYVQKTGTLVIKVTAFWRYKFASHTSGEIEITPAQLLLYYNGVMLTKVNLYTPTPLSNIDNFKEVQMDWELTAGAGDIGKNFAVYFQPPVWNGVLAQPAIELSGDSSFFARYDEASFPNIPLKTLDFKKHLPDITVGDLLAEVKKLGVNFDLSKPGTVKMDLLESIINSTTIIDVTPFSDPNSETNLEESNNGVTVSFEFTDEEKANVSFDTDNFIGEFFTESELPVNPKEGTFAITTDTHSLYIGEKNGVSLNTWKLLGGAYDKFILGEGKNELISKLSPMRMVRANNEGGSAQENEALMPYFEGMGSSDLFGLGTNPFPLRMVFYRGSNQAGFTAAKYGGTYVLASTGMYGVNKNPVGDLCFRLDKSNSIIRSSSERFLTAMTAAEIVEKDIYPSALTLSKMTSVSKFAIDHTVFLVKSLSVFISKKGAQVTAYLLKL